MNHDHDANGNVIPPILIGQGWCPIHHNVYQTYEGCSVCALERQLAKKPPTINLPPQNNDR